MRAAFANAPTRIDGTGATAFAVAHEPIPKCVLPEVEVFLGEVPIDQHFAITGSINQRGQVQAIGGVNDKIEFRSDGFHLRDSLTVGGDRKSVV